MKGRILVCYLRVGFSELPGSQADIRKAVFLGSLSRLFHGYAAVSATLFDDLSSVICSEIRKLESSTFVFFWETLLAFRASLR